ncbi:MAG: dienelactone hydrolase family protein [Chloroflexota bacterium]|nr:MAG: dienelactone hydrolase family protein [Chloroflexota bacterium]
MSGKEVEYSSNGGRTRAYLSLPPSGQGPGVVVIHEWWGLGDQICGVADRLARAGFVALVPDLYHGEIAREPDEAGKLMMALNMKQVAQDLTGAAKYLLAQPDVTSKRVGVIGFCMGGQLALYGATTAPELYGAVVDMYGIHPNAKPDYAKLGAPVLGLFGAKDTSLPPAAVNQLEQTLLREGIETQFHIYPNVGHAFMNERRPEAYDAQMAEDAWGRIVTFFRSRLT